MVQRLPKKYFRKDVDPLDLLEYRHVAVNPPRPKPGQFGDRQMQAAICYRCSMKVQFYSMRGNVNEEEERQDRLFVFNSLSKHMRDIHGEDIKDKEKLRREFVMVNVSI